MPFPLLKAGCVVVTKRRERCPREGRTWGSCSQVSSEIGTHSPAWLQSCPARCQQLMEPCRTWHFLPGKMCKYCDPSLPCLPRQTSRAGEQGSGISRRRQQDILGLVPGDAERMMHASPCVCDRAAPFAPRISTRLTLLGRGRGQGSTTPAFHC